MNTGNARTADTNAISAGTDADAHREGAATSARAGTYSHSTTISARTEATYAA